MADDVSTGSVWARKRAELLKLVVVFAGFAALLAAVLRALPAFTPCVSAFVCRGAVSAAVSCAARAHVVRYVQRATTPCTHSAGLAESTGARASAGPLHGLACYAAARSYRVHIYLVWGTRVDCWRAAMADRALHSLQTFSLPGSLFLVMVTGALYPMHIALPAMCLVRARSSRFPGCVGSHSCGAQPRVQNGGLGALCAFMLSKYITRDIVKHYFPDAIRMMTDMVGHGVGNSCLRTTHRLVSPQMQKNREHMFIFILFVRITPFVPNFVVNAVAPMIDIPAPTFFLATCLGPALMCSAAQACPPTHSLQMCFAAGVAPQAFLAITMGQTVHELTSATLPLHHVAALAVGGTLTLLPILFKVRSRDPISLIAHVPFATPWSRVVPHANAARPGARHALQRPSQVHVTDTHMSPRTQLLTVGNAPTYECHPAPAPGAYGRAAPLQTHCLRCRVLVCECC
jgi:hypothetical protein